MPCCSPWNYGNYYFGNTAMQMMPNMYGQIPAMSGFGGFGGYSFPSPSYSMPAAAPMMAAATPLPVAFNPLVQGMYPMASPSPASWMSPSSFMSAISSGPMPYRPPAFEFPSNVGMVMPIPYGTPNPFLSAASSSFNPSFNAGSGSWTCCCCFCIPPAAPPPPPAITYYPRPVSVPQPYPVPCPVPVPVPNIQQVPVPRHVCVVAPPIMADCNSALASPAAAPLWPSQGVFTNPGVGQSMVMSSNNNSTAFPSISRPTNGSLPVYNLVDQSRTLPSQPVMSSLSQPKSNTYGLSDMTPSQAKNEEQLYHTSDTTFDRLHNNKPLISHSNYDLNSSQTRSDPPLPPILHGQLVSDSGWLPKTSKFHSISSIFSGKRRKRRQLYTPENNIKSTFESVSNRVSFRSGRRPPPSDSSVSEYDCPICQQENDKRRLRKYYGVSTVSSLLSSSKGSHGHHLSTNESLLSPPPHVSTSIKQSSHKSYRRHPIRPKTHTKSPSPKPTSSPILLRRTEIKEQKQDTTIHEVEGDENEEKKENPLEKKLSSNLDTSSEKSEQRQSTLSLNSIDE
jgi:hypothetical protein